MTYDAARYRFSMLNITQNVECIAVKERLSCSPVIFLSEMSQLMNWRCRVFVSALPLSCLSLCHLASPVVAQDLISWSTPSYPIASAPPSSTSTLPLRGEPELLVSPNHRDAYVVGPGDQIQVAVFNVSEFSGQYTVLVDGSLGLPFVGLVDVQGLTLQEVDDLLTQSYAPMLTRPPQLTVTLLKPRPVRVVVAGEVRRPGSYSISFDDGGTEETSIGWPTLTQVIRESGGITEQADVRRIELIRPNRSGEATVFEANLWDLIQSGDLDQDIRLRDGDRIIVPVATSPPEESLRVATSNFSPDSIEVQVVGEVPLGGTISLPVNASLNQAILAAGGLDNPRVQSSSVELVRLNLDGTVLRETYPVDLASEPNDENNPILRANDVVVVRRNTLARSSDFLSVLTAPFIGILTLLNILGL